MQDKIENLKVKNNIFISMILPTICTTPKERITDRPQLKYYSVQQERERVQATKVEMRRKHTIDTLINS